MRQIDVDSVNISVYLDIVDSADGTPEIGVIAATPGLAFRYVRNQQTTVLITPLSNLAAEDSLHSDGGLIMTEYGNYRLDVPDAAFAAGVDTVEIIGTATGMVVLRETVQLVGYNPRTELTSSRLAILDENTYQAKVELFDDDENVTDHYAVVWFKNAQPITSGITVPTIQVIKVADGSNLIASTAMLQVAALGLYRYNAVLTERVVSGVAYIAKVTATIDGSTRTWFQPIGRDS